MFSCKICSLDFNRKCDLSKHNTTKKHYNNIKQQLSELKKKDNIETSLTSLTSLNSSIDSLYLLNINEDSEECEECEESNTISEISNEQKFYNLKNNSCNTTDCNTTDCNTTDCNTTDCNTTDCNTTDCNTTDCKNDLTISTDSLYLLDSNIESPISKDSSKDSKSKKLSKSKDSKSKKLSKSKESSKNKDNIQIYICEKCKKKYIRKLFFDKHILKCNESNESNESNKSNESYTINENTLSLLDDDTHNYRVPIINCKTNKVKYGKNAPLKSNLNAYIIKHPDWIVYKNTSNKNCTSTSTSNCNSSNCNSSDCNSSDCENKSNQRINKNLTLIKKQLQKLLYLINIELNS